MKNKSSPELEKFNNPITIGILALVIFLIVIGVVIVIVFEPTMSNIFTGAIIAGIGGFMWIMGLTEHSPDKPREAGVIFCWGTPVILKGQSIVIGGKVILANYFPFYLDTVKVDISNKDKKFPFKIMSKDKIPMDVEVSLTTRPNLDDLLNYIQAGNDMNKVFEQIDTIVYRDTQIQCRETNAEEIQTNGENISKALEGRITDVFESKSFGTEVVKVQIDAQLPKILQDKLIDIQTERYQRSAENLEYETIWKAAKELQRQYALELIPNIAAQSPEQIEETIKALVASKEIENLDQCVERIKSLRLIKDQKVQVARIESQNTGTGNFSINEFRLNMTGK